MTAPSNVPEQSGETTSVKSKKDEVVQLAPFTVTSPRDYGYKATNSITATGSGASIRDTPMSITVITEDYINDKNLVEVQEAIRNVSSLTAQGKEENVFTSRGFQAVLKVDGDEVEGMYDLDFASRVEVIKGAVSVLQGRASAGGVVNVISRKPKHTPETRIKFTYGSYDSYRANIMNTGPLFTEKVAYLIGYVKHDRPDGWTDYSFREGESLQLGLSLKPFKDFSLVVDYQEMSRHENHPQHISYTHPAFLAAELEAQASYDANGLARPAAYPKLGESTRAWLNRTAGFGPNEPSELVDVMEAMYPKGYRSNVVGPDQFRDNDNDTLSAELQWKLAPWLDLKSTFSQRFSETESISWNTFRAAGGLTLTTRPMRTLVQRETMFARSELVSQFKFLGMDHRVLGGFEYQQGDSANQTLQAPAGIRYNPRTDPVRHLAAEIAAANPNGFTLGPVNYRTGAPIRSYYLLEQASVWDNRLNVLVGGRQSKQTKNGVVSSKFTPQFGAVWRIPGYEDVSVYASYGESYRPNFNRDALGNAIPPVEEVNHELGAKVEMFDGKLSGSASVYRLDQSNVSLRDYSREAELGISPLYILSGLARSEGAELEFIYSPVRNYQMVFSYSRIWQAETLVAEETRQQGVRLEGAPDSQFSLWNKYTFLSGRLKGAYVGLGVRWTSKMRIHPSWDSPIDADASWYGDMTVGYPMTIGKAKVDLNLNIKNLFDTFYFNQTFRPADPLQAFFTTSIKF